jgi:hypothetical protein
MRTFRLLCAVQAKLEGEALVTLVVKSMQEEVAHHLRQCVPQYIDEVMLNPCAV